VDQALASFVRRQPDGLQPDFVVHEGLIRAGSVAEAAQYKHGSSIGAGYPYAALPAQSSLN